MTGYADVLVRALLTRIAVLEDGLRNVAGIAGQFDADPDFRSIEQIASYLLTTSDRETS